MNTHFPLSEQRPDSPTDAAAHNSQGAVTTCAAMAVGIFTAAEELSRHLAAGKALDARLLRAAMVLAFGASDRDGAWCWKDAYEAAEVAQIMVLQRYGDAMRRKAGSPAALRAMIEKLAALVPTQTRRSQEMVDLQQFSTPLPLAALAAEAACLEPGDTVLEPSAGTGMLAVFAQLAGCRLHVNEIADTRRGLLERLFGHATVTGLDAASIDDRLDRSVAPSVVLMNPPFSVARNVDGRYKGATPTHVLSALARLAPGGRLVAITGANFHPGDRAFRAAFERIADMGRLVFSAPVAGRVYARHGTNVETRLTVIDRYRDGDTCVEPDATALFPMAPTLDVAGDLVQRSVPPRPGAPVAPVAAGAPVAPTTPSQSSSQSSFLAPVQLSTAKSTVLSLRDTARAQARAIAAERAAHPFDSAETIEIAYEPRDRAAPEAALSEALYEPYELQSISIEGAVDHPTKLVQSAAMASVAPPVPSYRPRLPASVLEEGLLSGPQLESVIYAGDAHGSHLSGWFRRDEENAVLLAAREGDGDAFRLRRGWFLGDGTGCGKGRQVAGIIADNWLKGRRRAVWVSKSAALIGDAVRDWVALGGRESDIVPLSRFRQGKEIRLREGILFVTYATLRSAERRQGETVKASHQKAAPRKASRLDQLVDWLGADFDGVIAFDEAHAMANAAAQPGERGQTKASDQGLAGLALQNRVADARIVYVSATGATVVSNLAYASRLGLWGSGDLPFATRAEFVAAMEAGGIAAMEIISRDLKALGLYLARSLSYEGVEYDMLVHELTPAQTEIYDAYAEAYEVIHNRLEQALEACGVTSQTGTLNSQAKSAARSAFESSKQRFFSHLISAMKCVSVIRAIEADLAAGHAVVVQVVSTSEALMERRLADIPASEWNDLNIDLSPREAILGYLTHAFPVQLYEPYTDADGNLRSRPARDGDGNPIICREAERQRDEMIERLGLLAPVTGALDQLLWHFGSDHVAEVTGRKRRIVRSHPAFGVADGRLKVENRPASAAADDVAAFHDDRKRILIFSDAGGTGRSYHADLGSRNQRLRVHFLLEPGWKADSAIQGLGRTNRTNQAQPPRFRPTATNVKGEKRFLSTIARRLDTLGAITKGQRETGGQGMFRAEDNLESPYARAALRQFYHRLRAGRVAACSYDRFQQMTGLTLEGSGGGLKDNLPPIRQFLNRCLALRISMQDAIFEAFQEILDAIVEDARQAGTLDVGLETLRAERFEIIGRKVIHEDRDTGSITTALTIERTERNRPVTLVRAREIADGKADATLCWNRRSQRAGIARQAVAFMDDDGVPVSRIELIRPMGSERLDKAEFERSQWEECDAARFDALWQAEVDGLPEFTTSRITMICGLLLPIWDRLPSDNMRIYRLVTAGDLPEVSDGKPAGGDGKPAGGERIIGRLVTHDQLVTLYYRLGLDGAPALSPADVRQTVMERGASLGLVNGGFPAANGLVLRRARVMGETRLELTGVAPTALAGFKALGCFTEIIQWKTRVFVPTNETSILARILEEHPLARMVTDDAA